MYKITLEIGKKLVEEVNMCILPNKLVEEVLARVPQEALPLLRSVSKSWKTLIDSPKFKNMRSLRFRKKFIFQVYAQFKRCSPAYSKIYAAECLDSPVRMKATTAELGKHPFRNAASRFFGSCNGLICGSSDDGESFVLWNPSTDQNLELPSSPIRCPSRFLLLTGYGFGHDAVHDDFKVVRLIQFYNSHVIFEQQFQVYSLKSHYWKNLPKCPYFLAPPSRNWALKTRGVFCNNALHWFMSKKWPYDGEDVIVALDLANENYHLVPQPLETIDPINKITNFSILDGCLCLMTSGRVDGHADMWIMRKYGAKNSWTKVCLQVTGIGKIADGPKWRVKSWKPIMYSHGSGKTYVVLQYGRYLIWYDVEKGLDHQVVSVSGDDADGPYYFRMDGYAVDCSRVELPEGSSKI